MPLPGSRPSWWDDAHPRGINGLVGPGRRNRTTYQKQPDDLQVKSCRRSEPKWRKRPEAGLEEAFDDPCDHQYYAVTLTTRTSALQAVEQHCLTRAGKEAAACEFRSGVGVGNLGAEARISRRGKTVALPSGRQSHP